MEENTYYETYETENEVVETEADDGITAGKVAEGAGIVAVGALAVYGAFTGGKKIFNYIRSKVHKSSEPKNSESENDSKKK